MKSITIFTPTFNRAHLLPRLYQSLRAQSSVDFCWLVVDDGSSDNTAALVRAWISEGALDIRYVHKPNGGMHTAHNAAYELIATELNVCIDSDDLMPPEAVANILAHWRVAKSDPSLAGMLGLDRALDGGVVGTSFPESGMKATLGQVYKKYKVRGDKKVVLRTDVARAFPRYPEFPGERLVPIGSLYTQIDRDYRLLCVNEIWAIVDYQPDGSSATVARQYFQSPRGFRHDAVLNVRFGASAFYRLKNILKIEVLDIILKGSDSAGPRMVPALASMLLKPISYTACLVLRHRARV